MRGRAKPANAVRREIVEYAPDQFGARTARAFASWGARAQAGTLSQAVIGCNDPSTNLTGYVERPLQQFTGAAALPANPVQYRDGVNSLSSNLSGEGISDPARRIFAERLRRRQ